AGAPRSGQLPLPNHVLRIAPGCRQPFVWGDAKAAGATELKPISSIGGPDEHGEADNEQRQRFRFHDSPPVGDSWLVASCLAVGLHPCMSSRPGQTTVDNQVF